MSAPEIPVVQPGPIAIAPVNDDIAAFLKEGHSPGGEESASEPEVTDTDEGEASVTDSDDSTQTEDSEDDTESDTETKGKPGTLPSDAVDFAKLVEALDAKDIGGLMEALGPLGDEILSSKAHKTLRVQAKDLKTAKAAADQATAQANDLITKLHQKYSDPIEVRKAIDSKDPSAVDKFIDYAEKTTGATWNDVMRWVSQGLVGRQARLQQRATQAETDTAKVAQDQAAAIQETKAWVAGAVTKADPALLTEVPEIVDLIIAEIKTGYSKGIDSPAKALPLAMTKLKEQHERLTKLFARKTKKAKTESAPVPAAKVGNDDGKGKKSRPLSIEEEIAAFKKEMGVK